MIYGGIDEAGYGPSIGPICIGGAWATLPPGDIDQLYQQNGMKLDDSKKVYQGKRLDRLEKIALSSLASYFNLLPQTIGDLFALIGDSQVDAENEPWRKLMWECQLPLAQKREDIPHIDPGDMCWQQLSLNSIYPLTITNSSLKGINKAALEWECIQTMIKEALSEKEQLQSQTIVDRLGGRRYYAEGIQSIFPREDVHQYETKGRSDYQVNGHQFSFCVGGESISCLTALASCLAKYLRELHMHVFNKYWSSKLRALKPTAGYPQDAKRWCTQIGEGYLQSYGPHFLRGFNKNDH